MAEELGRPIKGFHIVLPSGRRYQGAGETVPNVGEVVAGFVVRQRVGTNIYVFLPETTEEWAAYGEWERARKKGPDHGGSERSLSLFHPERAGKIYRFDSFRQGVK